MPDLHAGDTSSSSANSTPIAHTPATDVASPVSAIPPTSDEHKEPNEPQVKDVKGPSETPPAPVSGDSSSSSLTDDRNLDPGIQEFPEGLESDASGNSTEGDDGGAKTSKPLAAIISSVVPFVAACTALAFAVKAWRRRKAKKNSGSN